MVENDLSGRIVSNAGHQRVALLVLGMHRSGTSAVTRALNILGAELPADIIGAAESNQRGHWEPASIVEFNDEILTAAGSSWDDVAPFEIEHIPVVRRQELKQRLLRLLVQEYGETSTILIKDPRICRLIPFWREALTEFGVRPCIIMPLRSPLDVAESLLARDRMTLAYGQYLWLRHVIDAEQGTRDLARIVFTFDQFMSDWRGIVDQAVQVFGSIFHEDPDVRSLVDDHISGDLVHHRSSIEALRVSEKVSSLALSAFEALVHLSQDGSAASALSTLDAIRSSLSEGAPELFAAQRAELEARRQQVDEFKRAVPTRKREVDALMEAVAHHRGRTEAVQEQATSVYNHFTVVSEQLNQHIGSLNTTLQDQSSKLAAQSAALEAERSLLSESVSTLNTTRSRLTETEQRAVEVEQQLSDAKARNSDLEHYIVEQTGRLHDLQRLIEAEKNSHQESVSMLEATRAQLGDMQRSVAEWQGIVNQVQRSTSWQLTRPLRYVGQKLPSVTKGARRAAKLAYWSATFQLKSRLLRRQTLTRDAELLRGSDLLDPEWYQQQNPDLPRDVEAVTHYLAFGAQEGRNPGPHFDTRKYLEEHSHVAQSGTNPLVHFLKHGNAEWRQLSWLSDEWHLTQVLRHIVDAPNFTLGGIYNIALNAESLCATTSDPHIHIMFDPPLPSGWFRVEAEIGSEASSPEIQFDLGSGYKRFEAQPLFHVTGQNYTTLIYLPKMAVGCRFDPDVRAGNLRLTSWRIVPIQDPLLGDSEPERTRAQLRYTTTSATTPTNSDSEAQTQVRALVPFEVKERVSQSAEYQAWINRFDYHRDRDRAGYETRIKEMAFRPKLSVLMPTFNTPHDLLKQAIDSVLDQIYPDWELCIADDHSREPHVKHLLDTYERNDDRIKVIYRSSNGHISDATNSAFSAATGEWIVLLDHDDLIREHALVELALAAQERPDAAIIYSDEDKTDETGRLRYSPFFKPDFSIDLFRSQNYLNHLTMLRADLVRRVGGWRKGYEGSQDYDILLRILDLVGSSKVIHLPKILYHWRAVDGSTARSTGDKGDYPFRAGLKALDEHLARSCACARVERVGSDLAYYRVVHSVPNPEPLVSLVIPTKDMGQVLLTCVDSILRLTTYKNFEIIIVDNCSTDDETFSIMENLSKDERVRVLLYPHEFNYSAINNFAASHARGTILGLVNNDIEVITPGWLTEMVSHACRPEVGCVGAKLYYPNDTIQHGGVILGIGGVAGHSHKYFGRDDNGYFARMRLVQNLSAVTGACLIVRKEVFEEVSGLNAVNLKIAFNDVDFCLRVRDAGYLNVWTPFAELYHHESLSRGSEDNPVKAQRFSSEVEYMLNRWGEKLLHDPFYSPNLTLEHENFSYRTE